jgi:predicted transposase YbfD/YdcC
MHTQTDTAQAILARHADCVMTVKANMPTPYRQLKKLPWAEIPAISSVTTDHGRRARRTIKAALAPAWIGFSGAAQVAQLRRTVTRNGKKTVEVVYLITSDRDASPATLAAWVRGHWHIENKLHRASETLRRFTTLRPRCGYGPRACWAWRQRLSC